MVKLIYKNKIIFKLIIYLNTKKNYFYILKFIDKIIYFINKEFYNISPIYVIEKAIFNIILPIKQKLNISKKNKFKGISLKNSITKALILIIKYCKIYRKQSISYKISKILIQLYKKEHILYKNRNIFLYKNLNKF